MTYGSNQGAAGEPPPSEGEESGADGFLGVARLNRNLPRLHGFGDRDGDVQNAVMKLALHVIYVEPVREGHRRGEVTVSEMGETVLLQAFGRLALARDYQLIPLDRHVYVVLPHPWKDGAQTQGILVPAGLQGGTECPVAPLRGAGRCPVGGIAVEVVEEMVDRTPELVQRLSNIVCENSTQHRFDLQNLLWIRQPRWGCLLLFIYRKLARLSIVI